jgi:hypothetical protein
LAPADADRKHADVGGTLGAGEIATKSAVLTLFLVQLLLANNFEIWLLRIVRDGHGFPLSPVTKSPGL